MFMLKMKHHFVKNVQEDGRRWFAPSSNDEPLLKCEYDRREGGQTQ